MRGKKGKLYYIRLSFIVLIIFATVFSVSSNISNEPNSSDIIPVVREPIIDEPITDIPNTEPIVNEPLFDNQILAVNGDENLISPLNTHTATVTLTPNQAKCEDTIEFNVEIEHTGGDPIKEVRIYNGSFDGFYTNFPPHANFECGPAPNSNWILIDLISSLRYCFYAVLPDEAETEFTKGMTKEFTFSAKLTTESNYNWPVETYDIFNSWLSFQKEITIDCTPPLTTKTYLGPFHEDNGVEWIDGVTKVELNATDQDPHPLGVNNTYYRNVLVPDYYCWSKDYCLPCEATIQQCPEFSLYTKPFTKEEESCHLIEFYSDDIIGNVEEVKRQCVFVDKTPPLTAKFMGNGPYIGNCPPEQGNIDDECFITSETEIELHCEDTGPHPSGNETVWWKYRFTEDNITWSEWLPGENCDGESMEDGWCDWNTIKKVHLKESSLHELQWFCADAVNKTSEVDTEYFRVDNEAPVIKKEMFGSWLGDCPPENESDNCYVADNNESGVSVWVEDPNPVHAVNDVSCEYLVLLDNLPVDSGVFNYNVNITFKQDSTHTLKIWCSDALGNEIHDEEVFLVDSTPPETTKKYGEPLFMCSDWCQHECNDDQECMSICLIEGCGGQDNSGHFYPVWITSNTTVSLWTKDEKVGTEKIFWRNFVIENEEGWQACDNVNYCHPGFYSQFIDPELEWNEVEGEHANFTKQEESCHVIEYYSIDKLGNEEKVKWQCVYVDNSYPNVSKEIGQPKVIKTSCVQEQEIIQPLLTNLQIINNLQERYGDVYVPKDNNEELFQALSLNSNPCDSSTQTEQCAHIDANSLPNFVKDTIESEGAVPNESCGKILILSSGNPLDNDTTISTNMGNPGCGLNPDGFGTFDCNILSDFTPDADSIVLAVSSEWPEYVGSNFTDWMQIFSNTTSVDVSIDDWITANIIPYGPASSGTKTLSTLSASQSTDLRVADSGDAIYDTALIVVPLSCFEEDPTPLLCGNNVLDAGEECDDGNTLNGDGCSSLCLLEQDCEQTTYVSQKTPITLSCEDVFPHPVDHVSIWYRTRLSDDCENWSEWSEWIDPNGQEVEKTIYFEEDSCHELEYYCEDVLGNKGPVFSEIDIVDTQGPVINKSIIGPWTGDCLPENESDTCIIDTATMIHVESYDPEPHPVNDVTCDWHYEVLDDDGASGGQQGLTPPFDIQFPEESKHLLTITCKDSLGNEFVDEETFFVDKTPPITQKEYTGPFFEENSIEWINSYTNVTLFAYDPQPHPSGVAQTWWRNTLVQDDACRNQEICQELSGEGSWNVYSESFNKEEESCHLIEFFSVDNVNKTEKINKQCVFVDNTAPNPIKIVGDPKTKWEGENTFYPNLTERCWSEDPEQFIECWKITLDTPISMQCNDSEPHPVNHENICYRVDLDGKDFTEHYCDNYFIGEFNESGDGFCCLEGTIDDFTFGEASQHELEFYCEDALDNKGPTDIEKFKVEGEPFNITIKKKWNLISVPVVLLNDDIEEVLGNYDFIDSVWTYNGSEWFVYTPDGNPLNDNLHTLTPGWGYWVLATDNGVITIGGSLLSPKMVPPSRTLIEGWNLIGYYGNEELPGYYGPFENINGDPIDPFGEGKRSYCGLYTLTNPVNPINPTRWSSLYTYWEPSEDGFIGLGMCQNMAPGAGYWIQMDESDDYAPTESCPEDFINNVICPIVGP